MLSCQTFLPLSPTLPPHTHTLTKTHRFEAIVAANVLVKAAAFPLAVWQQKLTPVMAVSE